MKKVLDSWVEETFRWDSKQMQVLENMLANVKDAVSKHKDLRNKDSHDLMQVPTQLFFSLSSPSLLPRLPIFNARVFLLRWSTCCFFGVFALFLLVALAQILLSVVAPRPGSGLIRTAAKMFGLKSRKGLRGAQMRLALQHVENEATGSFSLHEPPSIARFLNPI